MEETTFINNYTIMKELIETIEKNMGKTKEEIFNYVNNMKIETFEKEVDPIKRQENILAQELKREDRRKLVYKNMTDMNDIANKLIQQITTIENKKFDEDIFYAENVNKTIKTIVDLKENKMKETIKPLEKQIEEIKTTFNNQKNDIEKNLIDVEQLKKIKKEKEEKEIIQKSN